MSQTNILKAIRNTPSKWKTLSEVGELVRGNGLPKTDFTESGVPAIHYGQIYTYYGNETNTTLSFVSEKTAQKLRKVDTGDVIITNTSENLEDVGKALLYKGKQQAVTGGHATIFKPSDEIFGKYFIYITQSKIFSDQKRRYAKGTKVIDVSATDMQKIRIPVPPLATQHEIVRILDTFTAVTSELIARKKQYQYYRDKLLTFDEAKIRWFSIEEISLTISSGGTPKSDNSNYYNGDIPWLRTQEVTFNEINDTNIKITEEGLRNSSAKWIPENCVIVAMYGATVGRVATNKIRLTTNQACANIQPNQDLVNYKYLFHYLSSRYEYIKSLGAGSQTNINAGIIKRIQVPIPSLEEQVRIVPSSTSSIH